MYKSVEHINGRVGYNSAQALAFLEMGDKEGAASGFGECRPRIVKPCSIGIGFDDGPAFSSPAERLQMLPVGGDGIQINGEMRAMRVHVSPYAPADCLRVPDC